MAKTFVISKKGVVLGQLNLYSFECPDNGRQVLKIWLTADGKIANSEIKEKGGLMGDYTSVEPSILNISDDLTTVEYNG